MDGTGNPWLRADIGIRAGRIAAVGHLPDARATKVIDAADRVVTPGFIDVHSHATEGLKNAALRQGRPLLAQGVTTIVGNPDGGGPTDLRTQREALEKGRHWPERRAAHRSRQRPPGGDGHGESRAIPRNSTA